MNVLCFDETLMTVESNF